MRYSVHLLSSRAFRTLDSIVILSALLVTICAVENVDAFAAGFLAARITLSNLLRAALVFGLWTALSTRFGLYGRNGLRGMYALCGAAALTSTGLVLSLASVHSLTRTLEMGLCFGGYALGAMVLARLLAAAITGNAWVRVETSRSVLIVGTGPRAVKMYRELRTERFRSHKLLGFVDSRPREACPYEIGQLYLGNLQQLERLLVEHVVDEVLIALPARSCYADIEEAVAICNRAGVEFKCPHDIHPGWEFQATAAAAEKPVFLSNRRLGTDSRLFIKRCIDIAFSALALVVLSPLLLAIAAAVKLSSPGAILFRQERYGLGRRRFEMYKFRSMVMDAEARLQSLEKANEASGPIFKMRNDPRVTRVGRLLRRLSLDELPQLVNVLRGDMSLVGPRPMSVRDVSQFNEAWLMRRFSVKPGLTCLWQINGRSTTTFRRWMELDMRYIDTWSLRLDARILAATLPAVVKGRGAM